MVEVMKAGAGGGRVGVGHEDDDMDDGMRCSNHPYRNNHGGICALCLQEKLGKLVSSSSPLPIRASSSSSSSSSFRSDIGGGGYSAAAAASTSSTTQFVAENGGGNRIPFLGNKKKPDVHFRRSKSTAAPGRGNFVDPYAGEGYIRKNKSWIWSFLYLSSSRSHSKKSDQNSRESSKIASLPPAMIAAKQKEDAAAAAEDDDGSPESSHAAASVSSFEHKVSRSRSVGCGSRSFSGDFFERISTGFGDCTLRRVESHREGKPKASAVRGGDGGGQCLKEQVKCGGIFGGFMIHTSSSSSSASSSYWVSSSGEDSIGKFLPAAVHGRSKNKGRTFASPMRAFGKAASVDGKRDHGDGEASDGGPPLPAPAVRI